MNSTAKPYKGYYSILQFVPDLERAEGANIGVVLFCPERRFLDARVSQNNDRVRHFFGGQDFDLQRIDAMKTNFAERVRSSVKSIVTGDDFRLFIDTRANSLRLTDPRPIKIYEPLEQLEDLFKLLVGVRQKPQHQPMTVRRIISNLEGELKKRNIEDLVKRDVQIEIPVFHTTETYPFSYQNGQPNLVKPAVFGTKLENVVQKASKLAIEGNALMERKYKLNILAGFENGQERDVVRDVLAQFNVALFEASETEDFAELIARTAHV